MYKPSRTACLLLTLGLVVALPAGAQMNLTVEVDGQFPRELNYVRLKEAVVGLMSACRRHNTSGSPDRDLFEWFIGQRRSLVDAVLEHVVDDEYIPIVREPSRDGSYRTHTIVIDALARGVTEMSLDSFPEGLMVDVKLGYHLEAVASRNLPGSRTKSEFSVVIWHWSDPSRWDPEDGGPPKTCGFSYHH